MRKRERENPCGICGHYHKYEEGEVCGVCGHRGIQGQVQVPLKQLDSAFPSEILRDFLYLGSYDNASRSELLKTIGVSCILNTVPACQNLYKNSFTYFVLPQSDDQHLRFHDAIAFIDQCENAKSRLLVHCMSGKSRSAAVVIAYLMKAKGWRLPQSFQWVKERRPQINLSSGVQKQLVEYEQQLFGPSTTAAAADSTPFQQQPFIPPDTFPSLGLGFGFPKPPDTVPVPTFSHLSAPSIFDRTDVGPNGLPTEFTFGATRPPTATATADETSMDSS